MKIASVMILWLMVVFLAAKWVPNWQLKHHYSDILSPTTLQVLAEHQGLKIDVFALPNSAAAGLVDNFLSPLKPALSSSEITYIDTEKNPQLVAAYGISKQGEMVIHSGQDSFQLNTLSYEAFFNGLKRLDQPDDHWIVLLDGLDGKPYSGDTAHGVGHWLQALKAVNYKAVVMPWRQELTLPAAAKLIILPAPATSLSTEQITWLEAQITAGKSVWWLADPLNAVQQPALSLMFDVMRTDAYHDGHLILKSLPPHNINKDFDRPLDLVEVMPFETSQTPLWTNDKGQIVASTQELNKSRLLVSGDSDFISNTFLHSGGNLEMSFRMVDWLLFDDHRIDLPSVGREVSQIHLDRQEILWFAGIMLLGVPLVLLLVGLYFWRKQR